MNKDKIIAIADEADRLINERVTRDKVAEILGVPDPHVYRIRYLVAGSRSQNPEEAEICRSLIDEYSEHNQIYTVWNAYRRWLKNQEKQKQSVTPVNQRKAIDEAVNAMSGIAYGLEQIGPIVGGYTKSELIRWIQELAQSRRTIQILIRNLQTKYNELNEEENNVSEG